MDTHKAAHPRPGILLSHEKGEVWTPHCEHMTLGERCRTHRPHTVCDSTDVTHPGQAHPQEQEVGEWLSGAGDGVCFGNDGIFQNLEVMVVQL